MKRYLIALAVIGALAVYVAHNTVQTVKAAQYKQVTALSAADQIN
jgi:hypothetical protein